MKLENRDYPIGIFDSGIGGLTVLKEVCRILPNESIVYLGDTARVPYGIRSAETITSYSFECIRFLLQKKIKLIVIACNTVSSISLGEIEKNVHIPVIGVIQPGAKTAANITQNKKIGVIGTEATIKSGSYFKAIKNLLPQAEVHELACPLFVPLAEEGWTDDIIAKLTAERYLASIRNKGVDTLVLGCTHYPLLKNVIQDVMGSVNLVDSAIETSIVVRDVLNTRELLRDRDTDALSSKKFFVTDSPERFVNVGERFLKDRIADIEKIVL